LSIKNTSHITHHTFVFCFFQVIHHHTATPSHKVFKVFSSLFVGAGIVGRTRVAHQRKPAARTVINVEVGAVIKAGIARAAQAELVFIALRSAFIRSQFDDGGHRRSSHSSGSRSPVVRSSSSSSSHRSVVSESGATIRDKVEKAIQFFSYEKS
jgi:hypothetical protein